MKYWEDIELNESKTSKGSYTLTAEEIIDYASQWDPMPFHLSEEAAKLTPVGQLFASSMHSIAIGSKLGHELMVDDVAIGVGLGWQDVRFPQPVLAGDTLRVRTTVIEKRLSKSNPGQGIMTTLMELLKADDSVAVSYKLVNMVGCRPQ